MSKLFLFESGSTKTTILTMDKLSMFNTENIKEFTCIGFNPNRPTNLFFSELEKLEIEKTDTIIFYGSGLGSDKNKNLLKKEFLRIFNVEISVYDDLLGAARATYDNGSGVFAILGTGACVGFYDGETITKRNGGYGYLIDDFGGGYELGKIIVSSWLNGCLPVGLSKEISTLFKTDEKSFIQEYYSSINTDTSDKNIFADRLRQIASTVKLVNNYSEHKYVKKMIKSYFQSFFDRHILSICKDYKTNEIRFVGSLAAAFETPLNEIAKENNLIIFKTLRFPAHNLLAYHFNAL